MSPPRKTRDRSASSDLRVDPSERPTRQRRGGAAKRPARRQPKSNGKGQSGGGRRRSWLGRLAVWTATLAVWGGLAIAGLVAWYAVDLPDIAEATQNTRRPSMTFVSADGETFATYGDIYGDVVALKDLPTYMPQAILATEDRRFYSHFGVDPVGLARAAVANVMAGRIVQGGSTITQQLAKNLFLTPERSLKRKVQELLMALWLEQKFSKDQILTLYLNRVYLGAGTYGVDAAARRYFDVPAAKLSLYRAALIAGLLKAPTRYNPLNNPELSAERTRVVLANMVAAGYVTPEQAKGAVTGGPGPLRQFSPGGRYFADWLFEQVEGYTSGAGRDVVVTTSLDMGLQRKVEAELAALLAGPGAKAAAGQGAAVVLAPDGAIRAMAGGRDYGKSQFNRATQALRQPGSAFKPFVYLAALEAGYTPDHVVEDAPVRIGKWRPGNFDDKFLGPISLREAAARSVNTVAVRLTEQVGRRQVVGTAKRLGITSPMPDDASVALGTGEVSLLELTAAYATFAGGGQGAWAYGITSIRDADGKVLFRRDGGGPGRLVDGRIVAAMHDMLGAAVEYGTGRAAAIGRPAAGKTGTTQDYKDAWFVGYTADYVAGVWVGNDDGAPMKKVTGGGLPAQLWKKIMLAAHAGLPERPLPGSSGGGFFEALRDLGRGMPTEARPGTAQPAYHDEGGGAMVQRPVGDGESLDKVWDGLVKKLIGG